MARSALLLPVCLTALAFSPATSQTPAPPFGGDVSFIVSADSPIPSLSERDLEQIFTARRLRMEDQRLRIVLNPQDAPSYEGIARHFTGRSIRAFGLLWLEAGFQQAAPPPQLVDSPEEMVRFVLETPGAIGYVVGEPPPESVRVVHRVTLPAR